MSRTVIEPLGPWKISGLDYDRAMAVAMRSSQPTFFVKDTQQRIMVDNAGKVMGRKMMRRHRQYRHSAPTHKQGKNRSLRTHINPSTKDRSTILGCFGRELLSARVSTKEVDFGSAPMVMGGWFPWSDKTETPVDPKRHQPTSGLERIKMGDTILFDTQSILDDAWTIHSSQFSYDGHLQHRPWRRADRALQEPVPATSAP